MCVGGGGRGGGWGGGGQSNHWSLKYFIFMGNSDKILAKWTYRSPSADLNPLLKIPGSAPEADLGFRVYILR